MKNLTKILLIICVLMALFTYGTSFAGVDIPGSDNSISEVSIGANNVGSGDIVNNINNIGFSILTTVKLVIQGLLVLFLVYAGVQMIMSMGTEEETLSKSKRQIYYALIGLVFVNIPGSLYQAFRNENTPSITGNVTNNDFTRVDNNSNVFVDFFDFGITFEQNVIGFIEVAIFGIAVFMIMYAGIRILTSTGNEEKIKEGKNKIVWSLIGLIFLGFIESWKYLAFEGNVSDATSLFAKLANLALFFAGPIALFFLTLAGYYYITANGDEERVKKAKSIIINTIIATFILLASYTFLLDLASL